MHLQRENLKILTKEEFSNLTSNFISLTLLQALNYILPLITLPYLVKTLGIDNFGLLSFATATVAYFGILTDYGFNLTATKEISMNRDNKSKVVEVFSSVMSIKLLLLLFSFLLLNIVLFSFERFSEDWLIYLLSFGSVVGQFLFPIWFFQGMEKMRYMTYLNVISKLIFTIAIFLFIEEREDIYLVPLFFSLGGIVAGLLSLYIIYKEFNIEFRLQKLSTLKNYLVQGWHVFLSRFYVSMYTTTNLLLLGLFTNTTVVGYYSIAEKIVLAISGLYEPLNQTLYPYLARKYKENFKEFTVLLKNISLLFIVTTVILFILSQYFLYELIYLVNGAYNITIALLLTLFLFRLLTYPYGGLFSNALIIMQKTTYYMRVMNYTVLLNFLTVPLATYYFQAQGLIVAFILVTFTHVLLLKYYLSQSIKERISLE